MVGFAFLVVVDKQFAEMIQLMTTHKEWTLRPWKKVMEEQLSSWLMYIPGMSTSKEAKDMKGMKGSGKASYFIFTLIAINLEMLDAMTDSELDFPEKITGKDKERISKASGKSLEDVRMLLFFHKQSKIIQKFVQIK
jgi:signal recognition particle GTPase